MRWEGLTRGILALALAFGVHSQAFGFDEAAPGGLPGRVTTQDIEDWLHAAPRNLLFATDATAVLHDYFPQASAVLAEQHRPQWDYLVSALERGMANGDSGDEIVLSAIDLLRGTAGVLRSRLIHADREAFAVLTRTLGSMLGQVMLEGGDKLCDRLVYQGIEVLADQPSWPNYLAHYDRVLAAYFEGAAMATEGARLPYPIEVEQLADQLDAQLAAGDWRTLAKGPQAGVSTCETMLRVVYAASDMPSPTAERVLAVVLGPVGQL